MTATERIVAHDGHMGFWYTGEEIVRCRDCKHYRFIDRSDIFQDDRHNDSFCLRFVDGKRMEVEPDGFCAWAVKRTEVDA